MFSILTSNIFALQFLPKLFGNGSKGVGAGHWFGKDNTVPKRSETLKQNENLFT
jgi:hypothetical protein